MVYFLTRKGMDQQERNKIIQYARISDNFKNAIYILSSIGP